MNRIETAIRQNNCALVAGSEFITRESSALIRDLSAPSAALNATETFEAITEDTFKHLTAGGLVVLVEPNVSSDSAGLEQLSILLKSTGQKVRVLVVSKFFNRSAFPIALRMLNLQHLKMRGDHMAKQLAKTFSEKAPQDSSSLNQLSAALFGRGSEPSQSKSAALPKIEAPRPEFIGRESQLTDFKAMIEENGSAIVVHGPSGIGKRWLVKQALSDYDFTVIPTLNLSANFGADALMGRIAIAAKNQGEDKLFHALKPNKGRKGPQSRMRPSPKKLVELVINTLKSDALEKHVFVISGVEYTLEHETGHFYREGMLELIVGSMLRNELNAKVILLSTLAPRLYTENGLREVGLQGLEQSFIPQLFDAWHVGDQTESNGDSLHQQTHGHPLALRHVAIAKRDNKDLSELDDSNEEQLLDTIDDTKGLRKILRSCEHNLDESARKALYQLALLDFPADQSVLKAFDINRRLRSALLASGVLEQTPGHGGARQYYVHPLMRRTLPYRKLYDFDNMKVVAKTLQSLAKGAHSNNESLKSFAYIQSANVLLQNARAHKECWNLDVMFIDPLISNISDILNRPLPKGDKEKSKGLLERNIRVARALIDSAYSDCPNHPDALFHNLRLLQLQKADNDAFRAHFKRIRESGATPDSYHKEASFFRNKRIIGEVVSVLQAAVKQFPHSGTLHRRLADSHFKAGNTTAAEAALTVAVNLQPKMPENFSLMGYILLHQGQDSWEAAQNAFDMARSLGPPSAVLLVREAELLRAQGLLGSDTAQSTAFFNAAIEKLDEALERDRGHHSARVIKAKVLLDQIDKRGDSATEEEITNLKELLRASLKRKDNAEAFIQQARILIASNTHDDIERLLDKAYKIEKNRHEQYYIRGILYFKQENPDRAKQSFETAMQYTPKSAPEYGVYEAAAAQMLEMIKSGKFTSKPTESRPPSEEDQGFRTESTIKVRKKQTEDSQPSAAPEEDTSNAEPESDDVSADLD